MISFSRLAAIALAASFVFAACAPAANNGDASTDSAARADAATTSDSASAEDTGTDSSAPSDSGTNGDSAEQRDAASDDGASTDASSTDASSTDASSADAAVPCNTLAFDPRAPAVSYSAMPGSVAVLNGGTIADGVYYAGSAWSSAATGTIRAVWQFNGTTLNTLEETTGLSGANAIAAATRSTYTVSASGSTLTLTSTCGTRASYTTGYRASATALAVTLAGGRVNFSLP